MRWGRDFGGASARARRSERVGLREGAEGAEVAESGEADGEQAGGDGDGRDGDGGDCGMPVTSTTSRA